MKNILTNYFHSFVSSKKKSFWFAVLSFSFPFSFFFFLTLFTSSHFHIPFHIIVLYAMVFPFTITFYYFLFASSLSSGREKQSFFFLFLSFLVISLCVPFYFPKRKYFHLHFPVFFITFFCSCFIYFCCTLLLTFPFLARSLFLQFEQIVSDSCALWIVHGRYVCVYLYIFPIVISFTSILYV